MVRIWLRSCLLATSLLQLAICQQCYYPDGTIAPDVPCNATTSGTTSACCGATALCLENGLCLMDGGISRGSCTSENWELPCPQYCQTYLPSAGVLISPCGSGYKTCGILGQFSGQCGDVGPLAFLIDGGTNIMLRPSQVPSSEALLISPSVEFESLELNSTSSASTTTVSALPTAIAPSTSSCAAQNSSNGYSAGALAAVGVGVGVPLLMALAGASILVLKQRKQLRKRPPMREISAAEPLSKE